MIRLHWLAVLLLIWLGSSSAFGQTTGNLKVFIDCPGMCDQDYLRQNIEFLDYVREQRSADVHVLVAIEETGGGGLSWKLRFIGVNSFEGQERSLSFTTPQTASSDDRRKELARVFKIGLVSYALGSSAGPQLDVTWKKPDKASAASSSTHDPWNYWVFRIGANGNFNGEESSNNRFLRFNFSGSRTTQAWKINVNTNSNSSRSVFHVSDTETVKSRTSGWNVNSLVVKSLGPRWSVGQRSSMNHSSFNNINHSISAAPAIEYDFFPYSESSKRSFTVNYSAGFTKNSYSEVTIFDKLHETLPNHAVNTSIGIRAPWGSVSTSTNISQHLNKPGRYRVSTFGQTEIRLFKGFNFNIFGEYDRIRDQIALRKGATSTEDVLLRVQQLATGYSYFMNFGISYSFGSIFNSTVNPRFNGGGCC